MVGLTVAQLAGEKPDLIPFCVRVPRSYTPNDYPTELEWEARLTIERSFAIKVRGTVRLASAVLHSFDCF